MGLLLPKQRLVAVIATAGVVVMILNGGSADAFVLPSPADGRAITTLSPASCCYQHKRILLPSPLRDVERPEDMEFLVDTNDEAEKEEETEILGAEKKKRRPSRWEALPTEMKEKIRQTGQERAIANKQKREPSSAKKRRQLMFMKTKQQEKKRASRIRRPLSFDDRTPLSALVPGMETTGTVISLTPYGAYVDIGTECDGLLHISQLSRDQFITHPRQVLTPGEEVTVRVRSYSADLKKLHLTMLPPEVVQAERETTDDDSRIPLDELQVDDELWGELRRVTDYGAFVDTGAVVNGFLHFMDHPEWDGSSHPSDFMSLGQRVRVWVSDVDQESNRIKLTALRPTHLPGTSKGVLKMNH